MIHWHIWEPNLTDREIDLLTGFMGALTDEAFMPRYRTACPPVYPLPALAKAHEQPRALWCTILRRLRSQQQQSSQVNELPGGNTP